MGVVYGLARLRESFGREARDLLEVFGFKVRKGAGVGTVGEVPELFGRKERPRLARVEEIGNAPLLEELGMKLHGTNASGTEKRIVDRTVFGPGEAVGRVHGARMKTCELTAADVGHDEGLRREAVRKAGHAVRGDAERAEVLEIVASVAPEGAPDEGIAPRADGGRRRCWRRSLRSPDAFPGRGR